MSLFNCFSCSEEEFSSHCDSYDGICSDCGSWSCGGVEPDAENYKCEVCDKTCVFGAEQALIMGIVDFDE
jgi:hypothetical protein